MAAHFVFRSTSGASRGLGLRALQPSTESSVTLMPKKHFAATTVRDRNYGPTEAGMPSATSHWKTERVVSIALIPLIPAAIVFPTAAFDMGLSAFLMLHTHWGIHGALTDYVHGDILKPLVNGVTTLLGIIAFAGLILLNVNDVGFGAAVKKIYTEL